MTIIRISCLAAIGITAFSSQPAEAADDRKWGFCKDGLAYEDAAYTLRKEGTDWLCAMPTAKETGDAVQENTLRCHNGQMDECQVGAGGNAEMAPWGDHNVPRGAWFHISGSTLDYPHVRCQCGCFTGDIEVLTTYGYQDLETISKTASTMNVRVAIANPDGLRASEKLSNQDFTVGPEDKPIYRIETENGASIKITDQHPVPVFGEQGKSMIQARNLKIGDSLYAEDGSLVSISNIEIFHLDADDNLVYNLDTKGASEADHVILANGLEMGDLYWQKKLSEKESRIKNLMN